MNICQIPDSSPKGTICPICNLPIPVNSVGPYRRQCGLPPTEEELAKMKADAIGLPCCGDNEVIQESYEKKLERHKRGY